MIPQNLSLSSLGPFSSIEPSYVGNSTLYGLNNLLSNNTGHDRFVFGNINRNQYENGSSTLHLKLAAQKNMSTTKDMDNRVNFSLVPPPSVRINNPTYLQNSKLMNHLYKRNLNDSTRNTSGLRYGRNVKNNFDPQALPVFSNFVVNSENIIDEDLQPSLSLTNISAPSLLNSNKTANNYTDKIRFESTSQSILTYNKTTTVKRQSELAMKNISSAFSPTKIPKNLVKDPETNYEYVLTYRIGFSLSLVSLIIAYLLLKNLRTLKCLRNTIHCHLILSFIFYIVVWLSLQHIKTLRQNHTKLNMDKILAIKDQIKMTQQQSSLQFKKPYQTNTSNIFKNNSSIATTENVSTTIHNQTLQINNANDTKSILEAQTTFKKLKYEILYKKLHEEIPRFSILYYLDNIFSIAYYYFNTSIYFWMLCESLLLFQVLFRAFSHRYPLRVWVTIGWILPFIIVGGFTINWIIKEGYKRSKVIFVNVELAIIWMIIVGINLAVMIAVICKVVQTYCSHVATGRKSCKGFFFLISLLGIFHYWYIKPNRTFQIIQCAIIATQGFCISLYCCFLNPDVREAIYAQYNIWRRNRLHHRSIGSNRSSILTPLSSIANAFAAAKQTAGLFDIIGGSWAIGTATAGNGNSFSETVNPAAAANFVDNNNNNSILINYLPNHRPKLDSIEEDLGFNAVKLSDETSHGVCNNVDYDVTGKYERSSLLHKSDNNACSGNGCITFSSNNSYKAFPKHNPQNRTIWPLNYFLTLRAKKGPLFDGRRKSSGEPLLPFKLNTPKYFNNSHNQNNYDHSISSLNKISTNAHRNNNNNTLFYRLLMNGKERNNHPSSLIYGEGKNYLSNSLNHNNSDHNINLTLADQNNSTKNINNKKRSLHKSATEIPRSLSTRHLHNLATSLQDMVDRVKIWFMRGLPPLFTPYNLNGNISSDYSLKTEKSLQDPEVSMTFIPGSREDCNELPLCEKIDETKGLDQTGVEKFENNLASEKRGHHNMIENAESSNNSQNVVTSIVPEHVKEFQNIPSANFIDGIDDVFTSGLEIASLRFIDGSLHSLNHKS